MYRAHEVGHAAFDIFGVPIFGREEDAADNFATYIMLQFGGEQARRLIGGPAWAWRAYLGDYRKNPVMQTRLSGHSPQARPYLQNFTANLRECRARASHSRFWTPWSGAAEVIVIVQCDECLARQIHERGSKKAKCGDKKEPHAVLVWEGQICGDESHDDQY